METKLLKDELRAQRRSQALGWLALLTFLAIAGTIIFGQYLIDHP